MIFWTFHPKNILKFSLCQNFFTGPLLWGLLSDKIKITKMKLQQLPNLIGKKKGITRSLRERELCAFWPLFFLSLVFFWPRNFFFWHRSLKNRCFPFFQSNKILIIEFFRSQPKLRLIFIFVRGLVEPKFVFFSLFFHVKKKFSVQIDFLELEKKWFWWKIDKLSLGLSKP